jgi:hypothetical protein
MSSALRKRATVLVSIAGKQSFVKVLMVHPLRGLPRTVQLKQADAPGSWPLVRGQAGQDSTPPASLAGSLHWQPHMVTCCTALTLAP